MAIHNRDRARFHLPRVSVDPRGTPKLLPKIMNSRLRHVTQPRPFVSDLHVSFDECDSHRVQTDRRIVGWWHCSDHKPGLFQEESYQPPEFLPVYMTLHSLTHEDGLRRITVELTGRGDYIQPSIQSIKLRNPLPALRSNELLGGVSRQRSFRGQLHGAFSCVNGPGADFRLVDNVGNKKPMR